MLKEFLKAYFLRPENAFMTYRRAKLISKEFTTLKKEQKILDISCADGIFSFITAGGELVDEYDLFINVDNEKIDNLSHDSVSDIFDSNSNLFSGNLVKKNPKYTISVGTDWKNSLLSKASKLNLYDNLIEHDNNKKFNFEKNSFDIVYSNSIYWIENIDTHIQSIYDILKSGAKLILQIKTNEILRYHPNNLGLSFLSQESLKILDRGRIESWKSIQGIDWWIQTLESKGFQLERVQSNYSKEQLIAWHIGLRPIAHFYIKAFNMLNIEDRTDIKMQMVDYMYPIIKDIANTEPGEDDNYEYTLIFIKQSK
jgi:SAM-dependent methyltransferase